MPRADRPIEPHGETYRTYPIPRLPNAGRQKIEGIDTTHSYVLTFGSPIMLPDGSTHRLLQDLPLSKEQYEAVKGRRAPTTSRRIAGKTRKLLSLEFPIQHILTAREPLPLAFAFYLDNDDYRRRLRAREGDITVDGSFIRNLDPRHFDPVKAPQDIMRVYAHKAFVHNFTSSQPLPSIPHTGHS